MSIAPKDLKRWRWLMEKLQDGSAKKIRVDARLPRRLFAEHLDCSQEAVASWEAGRSVPQYELGLRYAEMLQRLDARGDQ